MPNKQKQSSHKNTQKRLTRLADSIKYAELTKIPLYKPQNRCK